MTAKMGVGEKGNVSFSDALNTFYLPLIAIRHVVNPHSDSEGGNMLLPLHGLLFLISSKGSFIGTIPHLGQYILRPLWSTR